MQEIRSLIQDYELCLRGDNKSEKYIIECTRVLRRFCSYLNEKGKFHAEKLTKHDLREWVIELRGVKAFHNHPSIRSNGRPLSSVTIRDYVQNVKGWSGFLEKEDYLERDPFAKVGVPKPGNKEKEPLKDEGVLSLLNGAKGSANPVRDRAMLCLLYDAALRRDEVATAKMDNVHFGGDGHIKVYGKGGKERRVPLSVRAQRELSRYLRVRPESPYDELFLSSQGTPFTGSGIYHLVKRIARTVGVEAYPHLLRHTSATVMSEAGMHTRVLQEILGHNSPAMALHYTHPRQKFINRQHQHCSPLDRLVSKRYNNREGDS